MSDIKYEEPKASKLPIAALTTRVTILVTLAISMGLLRSDSAKYKVDSYSITFNYDNMVTYQYVFFGMVAGFGYNLFQMPFAVYFFVTKKRLINNNAFLGFEFYGDKLFHTLLATVVGSLFGATVEIHKYVNGLRDVVDGYDYKDYKSKVGEFCVMAYVSAAFLIIAFLCSIILSIMSSRSLANSS